MNLLHEIEQELQQSNIHLTDLLRKALQLGTNLKYMKLKEWALKELQGYKADDEIPEYRIVNTDSFGDFSGPMGFVGNKLPIPTFNLPETVKEFAEYTPIFEGISSLLYLIERNSSGQMQIQWPANAIAACRTKIYPRMSLVTAYKLLPASVFPQIIDEVKTRLLSFLLEIEERLPNVNISEGLTTTETKTADSAYRSCISGSIPSRNPSSEIEKQ